jgi:hypothetical protein
LAHLKSYTIPFLDAGKFLQAQCDLFGSFVDDENAYVVAAAEALSLIKIKQSALDNDMSVASLTLESSVFTLMPLFSLFILIVGGCFFATDRQRLRLAEVWKHMQNSWNRFIHRNRVYDFGSGKGFDSSVRLDVQGDSRCDVLNFDFAAFKIVPTGRVQARLLTAFLRNPPLCSFAFFAFYFW